jgi:myo-inositol-1(or 4)-monophosphatase
VEVRKLDRLDFTIKLAKRMGKILLSEWGRPSEISQKSSFQDLVTDMDKYVQKRIISEIKEHFPEDGILAEEGVDESSSKMWVIDPIDGTVNFAFGLPSFSISIAYVENDEPVLGVVHIPALNETYYAEKGSGAYKDGEKIHVSGRKSLKESIGLAGFFKGFTGKLISTLEDKVVRIRMLGSIAVGVVYIAAGKADFYVAKRANPWDIAAAHLILKEAGGKITDFSGNATGIYGKKYVFSNGWIHEELLDYLGVLMTEPSDVK